MKKQNLLFVAICLACAGTLYMIKQNKKGMFEVIQDKNTLQILTPGLKNRKTAKIKLKNGLQVYLISDPDADKSAASLAMNVGSWEDPKEYPGMAHFCEHLLFLATKTYPQEDYFQSSVRDNGGTYNAYTAEDRTVYMFTANHQAFAKILDQFAHFFIDPSFSPSGVQRELHAVDQESDIYCQDDTWRSWMVFKETANPNHPFTLFNVGNAQTLKNIPVAKVKKWFQTHYSSHKARLVLYSPRPIQNLKQMATSYFSNMPYQANSPTSTSTDVGTISSRAQTGHITYVQPIKEKRTLTLTWELPPTYSAIDNKTPDLVAHIINSKASNSLYNQLKKEGIAESVYAEVYRIARVPFISIQIVFVKNEKPLPLDMAIDRCFQTIAELQRVGIPQYLFDEMLVQIKTKYTYQERENAFKFVQRCASQLLYEPLATYPLQTVLPTEYKASEYKDLLDILTPRRCIFQVMAPAKYTGVAYDRKEKWYGTQYGVYPISEHKLNRWQNIAQHSHIGLPSKNPFIPTNLTLKHKNQTKPSSTKPILLENTTQGKVFFYADDSYQVPHIAWSFQVKTPLIDGSAKQQALIDLYVKSLQQALTNEIQQTTEAGLHCTFYQQDFRLCITIHGYNDKASLLLDVLLDKITTYLPSKEQFEKHRVSMASKYANCSKWQPYNHAFDMCGRLFTNYKPNYEACLAIVPNISYKEFCNFSKQLFQKAYIEGFFTGNMTKEEAVKNWHTIKKRLSHNPYPVAEHHVKKLLLLPKGSGPYKICKKISMQGHAATVVLQGGDFSFEKNATVQVLNKALADGYFKTLRTKQQVAYAAWSWTYELCGQFIQLFCIQSSTHMPEELLMRTETFVEDYVKDFTGHLSEERFEAIRKQLITSLTTPPPNLIGKCLQLNKLAFEYDSDFDRVDKEVNALKKITYDQVKTFAIHLASRKNYRRAACLVQGAAPEGKAFEYEAIGMDGLKRLGTYVQKKKSKKPSIASK